MCALDPGDNTVPLCSQAMQYSGYIETLGDKSEEEEKAEDWSQAGRPGGLNCCEIREPPHGDGHWAMNMDRQNFGEPPLQISMCSISQKSEELLEARREDEEKAEN